MSPTLHKPKPNNPKPKKTEVPPPQNRKSRKSQAATTAAKTLPKTLKR